MRAASIFAGLTTTGTWRALLLIVIFSLFAWRIRRNMVIVVSSLTVILGSSVFLFVDSWEHATSPLMAVAAFVFIAASVILGIVIVKLLSGIGIKPERRPRRSG